MRAKTTHVTVLLVLTALLLAGCSFTKHSKAKRQAGQAPSMDSRLQIMSAENDRLRRQQQEQLAQLENLKRKLTASQAEQRRFQESMRSSFDLMEQSVALTLSRSVAADINRAAPAMPPAPRVAAAAPAPVIRKGDVPHRTPMRSRAAAPPMMKPVANAAPSSGSGLAGGPARTVSMGHRAGIIPPPFRVTPAALGDSGDNPMVETRTVESDPDLLPPANPRRLTAHPEAKRLYEKGFALFARKDYGQAILVFKNFLNRFPDDIYSDNAQFWIGESHLNLEQPRRAETAYRQVLRNFEHRSTLEGFKTPDAMYRLGQTFSREGQTARARYFFQVLSERFPETSAGRKAQRQLSMLQVKTAAK